MANAIPEATVVTPTPATAGEDREAPTRHRGDLAALGQPLEAVTERAGHPPLGPVIFDVLASPEPVDLDHARRIEVRPDHDDRDPRPRGRPDRRGDHRPAGRAEQDHRVGPDLRQADGHIAQADAIVRIAPRADAVQRLADQRRSFGFVLAVGQEDAQPDLIRCSCDHSINRTLAM